MKKSLASLILSSIILTACGTNTGLNEVASTELAKSEDTVLTSSNKNIQTNILSNSKTNKNIANIPTTKVATAPIVTNVIPVVKRVNISENYNTDTILVGLKSEADFSKMPSIETKYNVKVNNFIKGINTVIFSTNGQNAPDLIKKLATENIFSYLETDNVSTNKPEKDSEVTNPFGILDATNIVNDPYFSKQYSLTATHVTDAWALSTGKNEIVAVIDSGVDIDHPDLKGQILSGYNAFSKKEGVNAGDASVLNYISTTYKHGSHVAGIIAAVANNGKGIAGVAPNAKILPVKIFPDLVDYFKTSKKNTDGSAVTVVSAIADGIVWSTDHHADVINMSLAVWEQSTTVEMAVKYALDHNVSVVVAAGNERASGNQKNFLAAIKGVIAVGATDAANNITYFSNSGDYVSVAAPGNEIISTTPSILHLKEYRNMTGTSMASPHVAGIVALIKSKFGTIATPEWVKNRLEKTATDLGDAGRDDLYGNGLVNAYKALNDPT